MRISPQREQYAYRIAAVPTTDELLDLIGGTTFDQPEPSPTKELRAGNLTKTSMADTSQWRNKIQHNTHPTGGRYEIFGQPDGKNWDRIGVLNYLDFKKIFADRNPDYHNALLINGIRVHPDFRNHGVAQAMMERLHQDYPEHKIDPGATTDLGTGFTQHLLHEYPDFTGYLVNPKWEEHPNVLTHSARRI